MLQNLSELANYYKDVSGSPNYVGRLVAQSITEKHKAPGKSVASILKDFTLPRDYLDSAFLFETYGYLKKALYHYLAYKHVQWGGYKSWADVTGYYGRFWGIVALTRLMGAGIFWDEDIKGFQVERNHGCYRVSRPKSGGSHENAWNLFYETFTDFQAPKEYKAVFTALHPLLSSKASHKTYEPRQRNWINYSPEYGYAELGFKVRDFIEAEKHKGATQFLDWESYSSQIDPSRLDGNAWAQVYDDFMQERADEGLVFGTFLLGLEALKMIAEARKDSSFGPNEFLWIVEIFSCGQKIKDIVTREIRKVCKAAA